MNFNRIGTTINLISSLDGVLVRMPDWQSKVVGSTLDTCASVTREKNLIVWQRSKGGDIRDCWKDNNGSGGHAVTVYD